MPEQRLTPVTIDGRMAVIATQPAQEGDARHLEPPSIRSRDSARQSLAKVAAGTGRKCAVRLFTHPSEDRSQTGRGADQHCLDVFPWRTERPAV